MTDSDVRELGLEAGVRVSNEGWFVLVPYNKK